MENKKNAQEVVRRYLQIWAPHLLSDILLMEELVEEANSVRELGNSHMHDAVHSYFVAWCAVRASDIASVTGGSSIRRGRPGEIWSAVAKTDRFAADEFCELRDANEKLTEWFSARIEEIIAILQLRLKGEAETAIDVLDCWLKGEFKEDDPNLVGKRRLLVKTVVLLRKEFGTASEKPEVPATPKIENLILREMVNQAKKDREVKKTNARKALENLTRRR